MNEMITHDHALWKAAVEHPFIVQMCNDTLSMAHFKDTITQLKLMSDVGLRGLLCDILHHMDPHCAASPHIIHLLHSFHPGGKHFENLNEILRQVGVTELDHLPVLPATEAMCDSVHKIGAIGHLKEQLIVLATMFEVCRARLEYAKKNKMPVNPVYSIFITHHSQAVLEHGTEWMHTAMHQCGEVSGTGQMRSHSKCPQTSGGVHHPSEHDHHTFRRTLQWITLINDSCMNRGTWEWPLSQHYHHATVARSTGA